MPPNCVKIFAGITLHKAIIIRSPISSSYKRCQLWLFRGLLEIT